MFYRGYATYKRLNVVEVKRIVYLKSGHGANMFFTLKIVQHNQFLSCSDKGNMKTDF